VHIGEQDAILRIPSDARVAVDDGGCGAWGRLSIGSGLGVDSDRSVASAAVDGSVPRSCHFDLAAPSDSLQRISKTSARVNGPNRRGDPTRRHVT
jgi:hypothetical protein